ncbi:Aromatic-L-amino-acid decarboxylase [Sarcoptes scabiei]|nr:Aromatic-L-amino-acid decarboxylase [Sarcoptes scabiei]
MNCGYERHKEIEIRSLRNRISLIGEELLIAHPSPKRKHHRSIVLRKSVVLLNKIQKKLTQSGMTIMGTIIEIVEPFGKKDSTQLLGNAIQNHH